MVSILIGIHAFLGELGIAAFLWVFIGLLRPDKKRIKRAKIAATLGVIFIFLSWFVGGYYYVTTYSEEVKPIIKEGPQPWAHGVAMEVKEHVFLFLPFLAIYALALIKKFEGTLEKNKKEKKAILLISATIIVLGGLMALMGYLVSSGARAGLEALV